MIQFKCPHCQKAYGIKDEFAGRKATCQGCQKVMVIPAASPAAAAPPPAGAAKPAAEPPKPAAKPAAAPPPAAKAPPPAAKPSGPPPVGSPTVPAAKAPAAPKPAAANGPAAPAAPKPAAAAAPPAQAPAAAKPAPAASVVKPKPAATKPAIKKPDTPADTSVTSDTTRPPASKQATPPTGETEIDDVAADLLSDKPPPSAAEVLARQTLDFKCDWCDELIKAPSTMAGKQMPCPSCKRIVKVPLPTRAGPLDWRKSETKGPSGAKRDEKTLDDAWGNQTAAAVDERELESAGIIAEKKPPLTRGQKITRAAAAVVVVGLLAGGGFLIYRYWFHRMEEKAVARALDYLDPKGGKPELGLTAAAELRRAAAEFYLKAGDVDKAREQIRAARAALDPNEEKRRQEGKDKAEPNPPAKPGEPAGSPEREAALVELARVTAEAVPDPDYIAKAVQKRDAQKTVEQAMRDLESTLALIQAPEARSEALRRATRALVAKKRPEFAAPLAAQSRVPDKPEALGVVGLELLRADQAELAAAAAEQALEAYTVAVKYVPPPPPPDPDRPPPPKVDLKPAPVVAPSLAALCVALKKDPKDVEPVKPKPDEALNALAWRMGEAEGLARVGDVPKARDLLKGVPSATDQWRVQAALAAGALEKDPPDAGEVEAVLKPLEGDKPLPLAKDGGPGKADPSWLLLRLARLCARADKPDLAQRLAKAVPDANVRALARAAVVEAVLEKSKSGMKVEALRRRLEGGADGGPAEVAGVLDDWARDKGPDKAEVAPARLLLAVARSEARAGGGSAALKAAEAWEPETRRPFAFLGVALGIQDTGK